MGEGWREWRNVEECGGTKDGESGGMWGVGGRDGEWGVGEGGRDGESGGMWGVRGEMERVGSGDREENKSEYIKIVRCRTKSRDHTQDLHA